MNLFLKPILLGLAIVGIATSAMARPHHYVHHRYHHHYIHPRH